MFSGSFLEGASRRVETPVAKVKHLEIVKGLVLVNNLGDEMYKWFRPGNKGADTVVFEMNPYGAKLRPCSRNNVTTPCNIRSVVRSRKVELEGNSGCHISTTKIPCNLLHLRGFETPVRNGCGARSGLTSAFAEVALNGGRVRPGSGKKMPYVVDFMNDPDWVFRAAARFYEESRRYDRGGGELKVVEDRTMSYVGSQWRNLRAFAAKLHE